MLPLQNFPMKALIPECCHKLLSVSEQRQFLKIFCEFFAGIFISNRSGLNYFDEDDP